MTGTSSEDVCVAAVSAAHDVVAGAGLEPVCHIETIDHIVASGRFGCDRSRIEILPGPDLTVGEFDPLDPAVADRSENAGIVITVLALQRHSIAVGADQQGHVVAIEVESDVGRSDSCTQTEYVRCRID